MRVEKKEQVFQKGTKMDMEKVALNDEVLSSIQGGTQLPYEIKSGDTEIPLHSRAALSVEQH